MSNEIKPCAYTDESWLHSRSGGQGFSLVPRQHFPVALCRLSEVESALEAARQEEAKKWELKFATSDYKYDQDICELRRLLKMAARATGIEGEWIERIEWRDEDDTEVECKLGLVVDCFTGSVNMIDELMFVPFTRNDQQSRRLATLKAAAAIWEKQQ